MRGDRVRYPFVAFVFFKCKEKDFLKINFRFLKNQFLGGKGKGDLVSETCGIYISYFHNFVYKSLKPLIPFL
jgi:hypothetical protein